MVSSLEQRNLIVTSFLEHPHSFDQSTPKVILEDEECIKAAIRIDLNSLNFLDYFYQYSNELIAFFIDISKEVGYVITDSSPAILKNTYEVVLNSIQIDCFSADYVGYDYLWYKEKQAIIEYLSRSNYTVSDKTPEYLLTSLDICLNSLKNESQSGKYIPDSLKVSPEIFKYLLNIGYEFTLEELQSMPISNLSDETILNYYLNHFYDESLSNFFSYNKHSGEELLSLFRNFGLSKEAMKNFHQLIISFTSSKPTIEQLMQIWGNHHLEEWKKYRYEHPENYANLFTKIIGELKLANNFDDIFRNLPFWDIKLTIPHSYDELVSAMREYYETYHSEYANNIERLENVSSEISKYVALYIAASKEEFIKDKLGFSKYWIKPYFKVKISNPFVQSKIVEYRRRKIFEGLYLTNDKSTDTFVNSLIEKYQGILSSEQLKIIITSIIRGFKHLDLLAGIPPKPKKYEKYCCYLDAKRIVNRLNSGYLKFNDSEVQKYHSYIKWDEEENIYITINPLSKRETNSCQKYREVLDIYNLLNRDIMKRTKEIEFDGYIDSRIIRALGEQLPFTDEYFEFDETKLTLKNLGSPTSSVEMNYTRTYNVIYRNPAIFYLLCPYFYDETVLKNHYFDIVYYLMVECGLSWLLCMEQEKMEGLPEMYRELSLEPKNILVFLNRIPDLLKFASMLNYELKNANDFIDLNYISKHTDSLSLAIIGPNLTLKLCNDADYSKDIISDIIKKACYLLSNMCKRNTSTVPYVEGETTNYKYSMYDSLDGDILLAGAKTNACFKIDSTDNDFLFYSALDKNGFVIKITDHDGNFVARASGFRNGNCIFINQLRTIYDKGGNKVDGCSQSETLELVSTLKHACEDMIRISKSNPDDNGIDAVFITKSYILSDYQGFVIDKEQIGEYPMDNTSVDWQEFIQNTSYLLECSEKGCFTTDFASYPLLCIASSIDMDDFKIKREDVLPIYHRKRNDIVSGTIKDKELLLKTNRIAGCKAFLLGEEFKPPQISDEHTLYVGDNWYLITLNNEIVLSCVIDDDKDAIKELNNTIKSVTSCKDNQSTKKLKKED